jgi:xylose isomerase
LKAAAKLIEDRVLDDIADRRYRSFREGIGAEIVSGKATLKSLEAYALQNHAIKNESGRLEQIKAALNEVIFSV